MNNTSKALMGVAVALVTAALVTVVKYSIVKEMKESVANGKIKKAKEDPNVTEEQYWDIYVKQKYHSFL